MHAMCAAAIAGDAVRAAELDQPLAGLHVQLFLEANPIPVKWALAELGHIESGIRLPLTPLSDAFHAPVRDAMRQAGVM
jgi:4-hydroxy-tetrahydrodipicolinate synthase